MFHFNFYMKNSLTSFGLFKNLDRFVRKVISVGVLHGTVSTYIILYRMFPFHKNPYERERESETSNPHLPHTDHLIVINMKRTHYDLMFK